MAVTWTLPDFNCTSNVWHDGTPLTDPPDLTPACQFYVNSRGLLDITPGDSDLWVPPIYYRVPKGTDIRKADVIEVQQGDGEFYLVRWVERVHLGFTNEYLAAVVEQYTPAPSPGELLLEDGTPYLLESDGSPILLE